MMEEASCSSSSCHKSSERMDRLRALNLRRVCIKYLSVNYDKLVYCSCYHLFCAQSTSDERCLLVFTENIV